LKAKKIRPAHGKEYGIQASICRFLRDRGWHVERIVGLGIQFGLPDLLVCHAQWGIRFVEVKNEDKFGFTKAQKWKFPLLMKNGCGIWVLTQATEEQYQRLFTTPNLWDYLDPADCPTPDTLASLLDELEGESE
jgi:hypothetical protein